MMDEQRPKNDNRCPAFSEAVRAKNVMRANKNVYRFYVIDRGGWCESSVGPGKKIEGKEMGAERRRESGWGRDD